MICVCVKLFFLKIVDFDFAVPTLDSSYTGAVNDVIISHSQLRLPKYLLNLARELYLLLLKCNF